MSKRRRLPYHASANLDEAKMCAADTERTLKPLLEMVKRNKTISPTEIAWRVGQAIINQKRIVIAVNDITVEREE